MFIIKTGNEVKKTNVKYIFKLLFKPSFANEINNCYQVFLQVGIFFVNFDDERRMVGVTE